MMSLKQWLALFTLLILYIMLGATFYYYLETHLEAGTRLEEYNEGIELQTMLRSRFADGARSDEDQRIFNRLADYCGRPMLSLPNTTTVEEFKPYHWDLCNAVLFVITVVTTVGYGNLSPSTDTGRIIMCVYAVIGVPINAIVMARMAEFFSKTLIRIHVRYKTKPSKTRGAMVADMILYLIPGFVIFLILPSCVFMHFESWSFIKSFYYAFVTLTTIGFGDIVAGQNDQHLDSETLFLLYRVMTLIWILFGLGYLLMIMGYLTAFLRSKRVARIERKLANNIKQTQSKLWTSLTRDLNYLRRIVNEMYVMALKPVYKDEEEPMSTMRPRSSSDPMLYDLSSHDDEIAAGFGVWRRRTNSETAASTQKLPRVSSESDLGRIDRDATFKSAAVMIQPGELLAHMVNALGDEDKGVQGFTDAEILAGEDRHATWINNRDVIIKKRGRAASDVRIPMREKQGDAEWTWSGVEGSRRVHELFRERQKSMVPPDHTTRRPSIFQLAAARIKQPLQKRRESKSISDLFLAEENAPVMQPPMHPALEETSLADFLRAVSSLQSRVSTPPDSSPPRRKKGIGSFTPPGSITSLFPPASKDRRMSLRPIPVSRLNHVAPRRESVASLSPHPLLNRRMSLHPLVPRVPLNSSRRVSIHPATRRFSVRPVTSPLINPLPPSTTTPSPPPTPLHLMAPHLFPRQTNDAGHGNRKLT